MSGGVITRQGTFGLVEELGQVGEGACNDILLRPLGEHGEHLPAGGFFVKLGRKTPVGPLRACLCDRLGVPETGVSFVYEGRDLDDGKSIAENKITEPGPTARKAGTRVTITFMLSDGVELGAVIERRRQHEEELEGLALAQRLADEQARAEDDRKRKVAAELKAHEDAEKAKQEQEKAAQQAEEADRMVVRCAQLGETNLIEVQTSKGATVQQLAERIADAMGMRMTGGLLRVIHNDQLPLGTSTLRAANIEDGAEVYYYIEHGDA